jgi:hypothetical protein
MWTSDASRAAGPRLLPSGQVPSMVRTDTPEPLIRRRSGPIISQINGRIPGKQAPAGLDSPGLDDLSALVVSTVGTHPVGQLFFLAIGANRKADGRQGVVGAPLVLPGLGVPSFWIGHDLFSIFCAGTTLAAGPGTCQFFLNFFKGASRGSISASEH